MTIPPPALISFIMATDGDEPMQHLPYENARRFVALSAFGLLASVSLLEQAFGYEPCFLCQLQRIPWWALLGLCLFVTLPGATLFLPAAWFFSACAALLLGASGLAAFHAGVEQGWILWDSACTTTETFSFSDFQQSVTEGVGLGPVVSCADPALLVFGLSLAAWHMALALPMALWALWALWAATRAPRPGRQHEHKVSS